MVLVTFDLEEGTELAYEQAFRALRAVGLEPLVPPGAPPPVTVVGELPAGVAAGARGAFVERRLHAAGLEPKTIFQVSLR